MFGYWKRRRALLREYEELMKESFAIAKDMNDPEVSPYDPMRFHLSHIEDELAKLETQRLLNKARRLGIDVHAELPEMTETKGGLPLATDWWENKYSHSHSRHLTEKGMSKLTEVIGERHHAIVKKWVDLLSPIFSTIISLLALLLAALALYLQIISDQIIVIPLR